MFIRSERLFLRPGWPEERADLLALIGQEARASCPPASDAGFVSSDPRHFLNDGVPDQLLPQFLITHPGSAGARIVGCIGLTRVAADVNLGYWVAPGPDGHDFAVEAARASLSLARAIGHRRIVATYFVEDAVSRRILEKAGFTRTGRLVERYSAATGRTAPACEYAVDFVTPGGCGDDSDGGNLAMRQTTRRHAA